MNIQKYRNLHLLTSQARKTGFRGRQVQVQIPALCGPSQVPCGDGTCSAGGVGMIRPHFMGLREELERVYVISIVNSC